MRFRLLVEYDGTAYFGWQIQNGQISIQGELEKALNLALRVPVSVIGAGRTDTGVHARGQIAHFDYNSSFDTEKMRRSLNGILKNDIRVLNIEEVNGDFHSRYHAKMREYRYYITEEPTAFLRNFSWHVYYYLNLDKMNTAASQIVGCHDFKSFCRTKSDVDNHLCTIKSAEWQKENSLIVFIIQADRFLHGMVRALVGTFVDIGRSKLGISAISSILAARDRSEASQTAPAKGLVLEKIEY